MATAALTPDEPKRVHAAVERREQQIAGQMDALERIIAAADRARGAVKAGRLFSTWQGYTLINAMHDLTGCEALYDVRNEIGREIGIDSDGERILYLSDTGRGGGK